jgi:3-hydroxyacyl-[acyl-carrier-protein] dehydratase
MLLGHFFKIIQSEQSNENYLLRIELNSGHPIFEGHFPQMPVVPGVCQIGMLEEILSYLHKSPLTLKKANSIKFLKLIEPPLVNQLYVQIKIEDNPPCYSVVCQYYNESTVFFKLKGDFHG